ncbi:protein kinase domain-containing protein [Chondromyces apiculatus]|nr:serine/threonine-protein kinase [Chondromyces apiculatus]
MTNDPAGDPRALEGMQTTLNPAPQDAAYERTYPIDSGFPSQEEVSTGRFRTTVRRAPPPSSSPSPSGSTDPSTPRVDPLSPDLAIPAKGTLLGGVYRVERYLGSGAMGVILLAHDQQLQRRVAVKLLRHETGADAFQERLLDEARAMARVHHPNVMQIHAFGEYRAYSRAGAPQTMPFFVMEYVEGTTLGDHVMSRGGPPLDIEETLEIIDQVCRGVSALHAAGIAHRDIKPSNILITPSHRVVVADLGLAREVKPDARAMLSYSGTPAFMAPEIAQQRNIDRTLLPRCDVYAVGLLACWLLTGQLPFTGTTVTEFLHQHAYEPPRPPSELHPGLPPSFDAPLLAAMTKEPQDRTASAEVLRLSLRKALHDAPLSWNPTRLLVVDDSEVIRLLVSTILENALPRAQIVSVGDGLTAIAAIQEHPPALAIIDLNLPDMNGIELTTAIRSLPSGGGFPIIVITGTGSAADWQRLAALGASAFLVKPFDAEQLVALARRLLEDKRDHRART